MSKVDLNALIAALEKLNRLESRQDQLNALELVLVEAELNPSPLDFSDLMDGLELLSQMSGREAAPWDESLSDLEPFFAKV
jgi:hypothetical protein